MRRLRIGAAALVLLLLLVVVLAVAASDGLARPVRVAFLRGQDVHVLDLASGAETRLTSDGAATRVWWAADGRALFFAAGAATRRWRPGDVAEPVRDGLRSPDGGSVAFAQPLPGGEPGTAVWVEADGQGARLGPEEPWVDWRPVAWSPDGRWLALSRVLLGPSPVPTYPGPYPGEGALVLIDRLGGQRLDVQLPTEWGGGTRSGWPDAVAWAPTSERLAVWVGPPSPCPSCRADGAPVVVVDARGGRTTPVGSALHRAGALSWAPDGTSLVLSAPAGRETYIGKHLVQVDVPAGTTRDLARDRAWADTAPAVSPDGRKVAFARGVALVDGQPARPLPPELHVNRAAPASRRVWLVGADGSNPHRLTDAPGWADEAPVWTPDGRWVVFVRWRPEAGDEPGAAELWAARPDGTDARRLAPLGLPPGFYGGLGYYGKFSWHELFAVAPW